MNRNEFSEDLKERRRVRRFWNRVHREYIRSGKAEKVHNTKPTEPKITIKNYKEFSYDE